VRPYNCSWPILAAVKQSGAWCWLWSQQEDFWGLLLTISWQRSTEFSAGFEGQTSLPDGDFGVSDPVDRFLKVAETSDNCLGTSPVQQANPTRGRETINTRLPTHANPHWHSVRWTGWNWAVWAWLSPRNRPCRGHAVYLGYALRMKESGWIAVVFPSKISWAGLWDGGRGKRGWACCCGCWGDGWNTDKHSGMMSTTCGSDRPRAVTYRPVTLRLARSEYLHLFLTMCSNLHRYIRQNANSTCSKITRNNKSYELK
jgi:hypothetical protein